MFADDSSFGSGAGLEHRSSYALRHTFAAWSIYAGIGLFELARLMWTSISRSTVRMGIRFPIRLTAPGAHSKRSGI
jgi:integrase